jgi:CDP-diglyceride synthetase
MHRWAAFVWRVKTIWGVFLAVLATAVAAVLGGLGCKIGALVCSAAMSGDLFSSFLKRRMGLPVSSRVVELDQVPQIPVSTSRLPQCVT